MDMPTNESMLTTLDNPYNPFTQYDEWYAFDVGMGYNTCAYLARIALTSDELSEKENDEAISQAMKEILELNLTGNYITVTPDTFINRANKDRGG